MVGDAFDLPPNLISDTLTNATSIVADVFPLTALIAGIVLGLLIVSWIVRAIRGRGMDETEE